uniref:Uncharacterized protein n=1 Tax=Cyclophora tenuis TaxID=216820 RepID=A0A7S1GH64_CYCTE|mmetsp:Transcript_11610/g.19664  ORF Transcript_11610/g.19664 Transcript_11610/m.19664 type:complete len:169 (+) Transcript_11610:3-509(+)
MVMYSRAALEKIMPGLRRNALVTQARAFDAPRIGQSVQVLNWMYSIPAVLVPMAMGKPDNPLQTTTTTTSNTTWNSSQWLGVAGVSATIVGNRYTMHECHEHFSTTTQSLSTRAGPYSYVWHRVTGFHQTRLYEMQGDPSNWDDDWYTMNTTDCMMINQTTLSGPKNL